MLPILGCAARGAPRDGPFDHTTGKGHVPFHKGDYYDARHVKRNQVVPLIVEALGGIGRRGARCLRFLARRAKDRKRGRDGTRYSRFHPANFLSHHLAKSSRRPCTRTPSTSRTGSTTSSSAHTTSRWTTPPRPERPAPPHHAPNLAGARRATIECR